MGATQNTQISDNPPMIIIALLSCGRLQLLEKALNSLKEMDLPADVVATLLLVDNHPDQSALPLWQKIKNDLPFNSHYQHEAKAGISFARNHAIEYCLQTGAEFLCFIDDDEEVSKRWLKAMLSFQQQYQCPIVTGKIENRLPKDSSAWIKPFFAKPQMSNGAKCFELDTGNVLIHSDVFRRWQLSFDPLFALSGGEDSDFALQARLRGIPILYAEEALVYQTIDNQKLSVAWLLRRAFRCGCARVQIEIKAYGWILAAPRRMLVIFNIVRQLFVLLTCRNKVSVMRVLINVFEGAGLLLGTLGVQYREYASRHSTRKTHLV